MAIPELNEGHFVLVSYSWLQFTEAGCYQFVGIELNFSSDAQLYSFQTYKLRKELKANHHANQTHEYRNSSQTIIIKMKHNNITDPNMPVRRSPRTSSVNTITGFLRESALHLVSSPGGTPSDSDEDFDDRDDADFRHPKSLRRVTQRERLRSRSFCSERKVQPPSSKAGKMLPCRNQLVTRDNQLKATVAAGQKSPTLNHHRTQITRKFFEGDQNYTFEEVKKEKRTNRVREQAKLLQQPFHASPASHLRQNLRRPKVEVESEFALMGLKLVSEPSSSKKQSDEMPDPNSNSFKQHVKELQGAEGKNIPDETALLCLFKKIITFGKREKKSGFVPEAKEKSGISLQMQKRRNKNHLESAKNQRVPSLNKVETSHKRVQKYNSQPLTLHHQPQSWMSASPTQQQQTIVNQQTQGISHPNPTNNNQAESLAPLLQTIQSAQEQQINTPTPIDVRIQRKLQEETSSKMTVEQLRDLITHQAQLTLEHFERLTGQAGGFQGTIRDLFMQHCGPNFDMHSQLREVVHRTHQESDLDELQRTLQHLIKLPQEIQSVFGQLPILTEMQAEQQNPEAHAGATDQDLMAAAHMMLQQQQILQQMNQQITENYQPIKASEQSNNYLEHQLQQQSRVMEEDESKNQSPEKQQQESITVQNKEAIQLLADLQKSMESGEQPNIQPHQMQLAMQIQELLGQKQPEPDQTPTALPEAQSEQQPQPQKEQEDNAQQKPPLEDSDMIDKIMMDELERHSPEELVQLFSQQMIACETQMQFATEQEREQTNKHLNKLQTMVFQIIQKKQAEEEMAQAVPGQHDPAASQQVNLAAVVQQFLEAQQNPQQDEQATITQIVQSISAELKIDPVTCLNLALQQQQHSANQNQVNESPNQQEQQSALQPQIASQEGINTQSASIQQKPQDSHEQVNYNDYSEVLRANCEKCYPYDQKQDRSARHIKIAFHIFECQQADDRRLKNEEIRLKAQEEEDQRAAVVAEQLNFFQRQQQQQQQQQVQHQSAAAANQEQLLLSVLQQNLGLLKSTSADQQKAAAASTQSITQVQQQNQQLTEALTQLLSLQQKK